jgi:hypothetical protein
MAIPRAMIPGLESASKSNLETVTRLFAAATGRRGGRRKSKAKAVAAKANGARGGRPNASVPVRRDRRPAVACPASCHRRRDRRCRLMVSPR